MWPASLIYFNQAKAFGSPSYYVIKMLWSNRGDFNIEVKSKSAPAIINTDFLSFTGYNYSAFYADRKFPESIYTGATFYERTSEVILKIVNFLSQSQKTLIDIRGIKKVRGDVIVETLANNDVTAEYSFDPPLNVSPACEKITKVSNAFTYEFKANSFTTLRILVELNK